MARAQGSRRKVVVFLLLILGVELAITAPGFRTPVRRSPIASTAERLRDLNAAIQTYTVYCGPLTATNNSGITFLLTGGKSPQNSSNIVFLNLPVNRLDKAGNILDAWGQPFRFQSVSNKTSLRIQSLGPNGKDDQGQGDDLVTFVPLTKKN